MKSILYSFILLCCAFSARSQNYQCVQSGTIRYFTNSFGYVKAMRIDSVHTYADSTVIFPFHRQDSWSGATTGARTGSWMGSRIKMLPNGTTTFDTRTDTIFIKTQSLPGDTWIFYSDTSSIYYRATLISVDTMSFLGVFDSIKKIRLSAYHASVPDPTNPLHGFELILSKNNGLVKVCDLYTFPYYPLDSTSWDFYTADIYINYIVETTMHHPDSTNMIFTLSDYHSPTTHDIYDFNVGDVFFTLLSEYAYSGPAQTWSLLDSVVGKTVVDTAHVFYLVNKTDRGSYAWDGIHFIPYSNNHTDTVWGDTTHVFTTGHLPEEHVEFVYYYNPHDTTHCYNSKWYSEVRLPEFETCDTLSEQKVGFPPIRRLTYKYDYWTGPGCRAIDEYKIVSSTKNGLVCGPSPYSIIKLNADTGPLAAIFNLSPNPVNDVLAINASFIIDHFVIYDIAGHSLYEGHEHGNTASVSVDKYPPGMYLVRINDSFVTRFVKQ